MIEEIKAGALSKAFPGRQWKFDTSKDDLSGLTWLDGSPPADAAVVAAVQAFKDFAPPPDPIDGLRAFLLANPAALAKLTALLK